MYYYLWFGLFLVRSPLLQESFLLSFPMGTKMFQFPTFPSIHYFTYVQIYSLFLLYEFPHSDIHGLLDICSSPWLFAAYHVLLRLLVPRHSPYALCSLTFFVIIYFALLCQTSQKFSSIYTRIISSIFVFLVLLVTNPKTLQSINL